jgi:hypothetical protein
MAQWHVYQTRAGTIFTIGLSGNSDEEIKIVAYDHNIPPTTAKLVGIFQADSQCDYINKMIPILLRNLKDNIETKKIYKRIKKEGL